MAQPQSSSLIAGSVLPIKRAEELLATLPGVIAARIIAGDTGAVDEIHMLTTAEVTPKQTVRNVESALIAHLGMRVDHRKISVATTVDGRKGKTGEQAAQAPAAAAPARPTPVAVETVIPASRALAAPVAAPVPAPGVAISTPTVPDPAVPENPPTAQVTAKPALPAGSIEEDLRASAEGVRRAFYFEDVEVSRSRARGLTCRVTLAKGGKSFTGEAEGTENERSRVELAARATIRALVEADPSLRLLDLTGAKLIQAFDREFVFVGVTVQQSRSSALLTGSCEMKDSPETASVLAVLDATNRWMGRR